MLNNTNPSATEQKTISINIPKPSFPSMQSLVLILLIIVGALQTIQLFALDQKIAGASFSSSKPAVSAQASGSGSGSSALPEMVGGC